MIFLQAWSSTYFFTHFPASISVTKPVEVPETTFQKYIPAGHFSVLSVVVVSVKGVSITL
jgi:hypothetical protein